MPIEQIQPIAAPIHDTAAPAQLPAVRTPVLPQRARIASSGTIAPVRRTRSSARVAPVRVLICGSAVPATARSVTSTRPPSPRHRNVREGIQQRLRMFP